jgi:HEAT repeat protein
VNGGILRLILSTLCVIVLARPALGQQPRTAADLIEQFKIGRVFWSQLEVAKELVKLHDLAVLPALELYLKDDDRHVRGNAALVFAGLGDDRGFKVIHAILEDHSARPKGQGGQVCSSGPGNCPSLQIRTDRYYAAHLFGDLKDARAVPMLVPLLKDPDVNYIVPWSLGEIGDHAAIPPLIETLNDKNPDMRVLAIYALETLGAKEALPQLRTMLNDHERIHFDGEGSVAGAARAAIDRISKGDPSPITPH